MTTNAGGYPLVPAEAYIKGTVWDKNPETLYLCFVLDTGGMAYATNAIAVNAKDKTEAKQKALKAIGQVIYPGDDDVVIIQASEIKEGWQLFR